MKSGEELHNKVYQSPRLPRKTVFTPNLHHGSQDLSILEARTSTDHQSKQSERYVNHVAKERWVPSLVDVHWYAFFQALYKGIAGEDWEAMPESFKEMSRAVGVKQPQEAQKAKALWKMKAAKDAGVEYYDLTRKDNIKGKIKTRLALWED